MISYAQNLEDVMLNRALKDVQNGFYIDVGANDPEIDSVTLAFYLRGWRGINIEPLEHHYLDLQARRPLDINLRVAAGPEKGTLKIWECDVRGWATADANVIKKHTFDGHKGHYIEVPMVPLTSICEAHVLGEIHFLKIDVEGFEKAVLDGFDFERFKPWVVVIEATKPNSTVENHLEWELTLLRSNYQLAYADGLNRFYISPLHPELLQPLKYPPNVLDSFGTAKEVSLKSRISDLEVLVLGQESKAIESGYVIERQAADITRLNVQFDAATVQIYQLSASASEAKMRAELATANSMFSLEKSQMQQTLIEELGARSATLSDSLGRAQAETLSVQTQNLKVSEQLDSLNHLFRETLDAFHRANGEIRMAQVAVSDANNEVLKANYAAHQAHGAYHQANYQLISANEKINSIYASTSWRLTGPIRRIVRLFKSEKLLSDASPSVESLNVHAQIESNEPVAVMRVDIQSLLGEIRQELGAFPKVDNLSSGSHTAAAIDQDRIKRLRSLWFRLPPHLRNQIRRLPFFFRAYRWIVFRQ